MNPDLIKHGNNSEKKGGKVARVFPGFPAERAAIAPGDVLIAVNNIALAGKTREEVLDLLAGEPGTLMAVTIQRGNDILKTEFLLQ